MSFQIQRARDIPPAFEALKSRAQAIYVVPNPILFVNRIRINTLAVGSTITDHATACGSTWKRGV